MNNNHIVTVIIVAVVAMWAWGLMSHVAHEHHPARADAQTTIDAGTGADLQGE